MVQNQLRIEASRLHTENDKLSTEVTRLEGQVGRYVSVYSPAIGRWFVFLH